MPTVPLRRHLAHSEFGFTRPDLHDDASWTDRCTRRSECRAHVSVPANLARPFDSILHLALILVRSVADRVCAHVGPFCVGPVQSPRPCETLRWFHQSFEGIRKLSLSFSFLCFCVFHFSFAFDLSRGILFAPTRFGVGPSSFSILLLPHTSPPPPCPHFAVPSLFAHFLSYLLSFDLKLRPRLFPHFPGFPCSCVHPRDLSKFPSASPDGAVASPRLSISSIPSFLSVDRSLLCFYIADIVSFTHRLTETAESGFTGDTLSATQTGTCLGDGATH